MAKGKMSDYIPTWSEQVIDKQQEEIATLKAQLAKHGGHTADCLRHTRMYTVGDDCCIESCGWQAIAKELG